MVRRQVRSQLSHQHRLGAISLGNLRRLGLLSDQAGLDLSCQHRGAETDTVASIVWVRLGVGCKQQNLVAAISVMVPQSQLQAHVASN